MGTKFIYEFKTKKKRLSSKLTDGEKDNQQHREDVQAANVTKTLDLVTRWSFILKC